MSSDREGAAGRADDEGSRTSRLRRLVEHLEARLDPASARGTEPAAGGAPESAGRLMDWMRSEMSARSLGVEPGKLVELDPLPPPAPPPEPARLAPPAHSASHLPAGEAWAPIARRDRYRLEDLLHTHDEAFIRDAYSALLRREPDPGGLAYYRQKLRSGELSRIEILGMLRGSEEGRKANVAVERLGSALRFRRWTRVPVLGHILATLRYLGSLPMLVRSLEGLHARIEGGQRDMVERLRDAHAALQESDRRQAEYGVAVASGIRNLEAANAALREHAAAAAGRIAALQASQLALRKWTAAFGEGLIAERRSGMEFRRELLQASRMMLESVEQLETFAARIERRAGIARTEPDLDEFYARFEDRFRGTPEDIRSRLQVYVPTVEAAVRGAGDAPVLDLGCGRGEWLELLRERGIAASGADANAEMARRCRERGLDVEHRDAFAHLARLGDGHAGAVTAFHVIEHLPFERLVTLFDEALRVLRPGGAIVFETPNPENLIVGACNFWHDPTHVHPLPPEMVRFVAEARGFERAEILRLHPFPDWQHIAPGPHEGLRKRLNELLYGAQDYSVIAYKPRNGA